MDVHEWHCNTELIPKHQKIFGKWSDIEIRNKWYLNRLSVVCYLRDNMIRCKNMNTNKIQLLKSNDTYDKIYKEINKINKPNNNDEYKITVNYLKDKLLANLDQSFEFNENLKQYLSFTIYYSKDYSSNLPLLKEIIDRVYLLHDQKKININIENLEIIKYLKDTYY